MNKKLVKLTKKYWEIEEQIKEELGKKDNDECNCDSDDREEISFIHYGEWEEIISFCLNCGGAILNRM